jgi:hypothetical protein
MMSYKAVKENPLFAQVGTCTRCLETLTGETVLGPLHAYLFRCQIASGAFAFPELLRLRPRPQHKGVGVEMGSD